MIVSTKAENHRLYSIGALGNSVRNWSSLDDCLKSGFDGPFVIRYNVPGSPFCVYNIPDTNALFAETLRLTGLGADPSLLVFSEQAPDHLIVWQGEIWNPGGGFGGLLIEGSRCRLQMRDALRVERTRLEWMEAYWFLLGILDTAGWENLWYLLDTYPGCIIEMSVYSRAVGKLGWNSLWWETRSY